MVTTGNLIRATVILGCFLACGVWASPLISDAQNVMPLIGQPLSADILTSALTAEDRLVFVAEGEVGESPAGAGESTTLRIYRDGPRDLTRYEYTGRGAAGMVVIQRGDEQWQSQDDGTWLHEDLLPDMLISFPDRLSLLLENYEIETAGMKTIGGRECWGYNILPRNSGNPSRQIYIDAETHLPLRAENTNGLGELVSLSIHSSVEYVGELDPELFEAPSENVEEDPVERTGPVGVWQAGSDSGLPVREPGYVPAGYNFAGAFIIEQGRSTAAHLQWFDGLSLISLFVQQTGGPMSKDVWTEYHANSVSWAANGVSYQLMGDVIPTELSRMRDSIR